MSRLSRSAALACCAFAALAVLVAAGVFTGVDQWAVDQLMPGASFHHAQGGLLDGLVPLLHSRWDSPFAVAANVVTLPAAFLFSLAIAFACSRALGIALVAAVAVEVLCKELLERPALHHGSFHIATFDSSFPSGHALRTVIVAAAVASIWPRARPFAAAWAIGSIALLLLAGWHTPTDLAGGVLLGGLVMWPVALPGSWVASTKRCKDAGRARSRATGVPEDAAARRVIAGQGPGERCRLRH